MQSTGNPNLQVYMDGVQEGADDNDDFTANVWGTSFYVGLNVSSVNHFNGIIQAVAIYSDFKDATAVAAITDILEN